jgi:hypothetical protein
MCCLPCPLDRPKEIAVSVAEAVRPTAEPVDVIMAYENEQLYERFVTDHGGSLSDARERFVALKQFLTVCAVLPGIKVASDEIDQMWHTFLLFTREYRNFCNDRLGLFIEHEPFEDSQPTYYEATRNFADGMFGELDLRYWPLEGKADCTSGCAD